MLSDDFLHREGLSINLFKFLTSNLLRSTCVIMLVSLCFISPFVVLCSRTIVREPPPNVSPGYTYRSPAPLATSLMLTNTETFQRSEFK